MANRFTLLSFVLFLHCSFLAVAGTNYYWISSANGDWSDGNNWSLTSGGSPASATPGTGDNVIFNGAGGFNGNCSVNSSYTVTNITVSGYNGTITISTGNTLSAVGGTISQTSGSITGGTLFTNHSFQISGVTIGSNVSGTNLTQLTLSNITVTGTVSISVGTTTTHTVTGCMFTNTVIFDNNSSNGTLSLTNNVYNASTQWILDFTGVIRGNSETYNGDLTILNKSTGSVNPSYSGSSTYNGNLTLNNASTGVINFASTGGRSLFNNNALSNNTISITGDNGQYLLKNLTYNATTPFAASVPNNATVRLAACTFAADVSLTAKSITLNANAAFGGNTFNGNVTLNMQGIATTNHMISASIFNKNTTITVTTSKLTIGATGSNTFGSGTSSLTSITLASGASLNEFGSSPTYYGDLTVDGQNGSTIVLASGGVANYYANVHLKGPPKSSGSTTLGSGSSAAVLKSGFQMDITDNSTYNIINFTVEGITSPIAWNCPNSNFSIQSSTFNSDVNITCQKFTSTSSTSYNGNFTVTLAPSTVSTNITMDGNFFAKTAIITNNYTCLSCPSRQIALTNNTFQGQTTITNTASTNTSIYDNGGNVYNAPVTCTNSSATAGIYPANSGTNTYNGDLTINSSSVTTIAANANGGNNGLLVFGGASNRSFNDTGSAKSIFNNVQFNFSGGNLTLNSPMTVAGAASFTAGIVTASTSNPVYFANNATATGASDASYVDGQVFKTGNQAFAFPIGGGGHHRPLSISAPTNSTDQYDVQYLTGDPSQLYGTTFVSPIIKISGCEYWLFNTGSSNSQVNATLSWNASSCGTNYVGDPASLVVASYNASSSTWQTKGNQSTTSDATFANGTIQSSVTISSSAFGDSGPITLGTSSLANPLPITLRDFRAVATDNGVEVSWETASEINSDYFQIERSKNGEVFESVGKIKGKGTTSTLSTYSFVDDHPYEGTSYYRLAHFDFDKAITYSPVKAVTTELPLQCYPNPVRDILHLTKSGRVRIMDVMGSILYESKGEVDTVNVTGLTSGTYLMTDGIRVQKIIIVR